MTSSVGGRMAMVLVALAISLTGIIGVINRSFMRKGHLEEIAAVKISTLLLTTICCPASLALAQAPAAPAATPAASAAVTARRPEECRHAEARGAAKGDPDGTLTGTAADIPVADAKKGLTIGDVVNQVGQNKIAINFVWTLVTGFLVMFMQAGFAIVETGLCRAKNANHTMMMNFMVYGVGMLAYWLIGFAIQMGGVGGVAQSGRHAAAEHRVRHQPVRQAVRPVRAERLLPDARRHL